MPAYGHSPGRATKVVPRRRSQRIHARDFLPNLVAVRPLARKVFAWTKTDHAIRPWTTLPRIEQHLSFASIHPLPKSDGNKRSREIDALRALDTSVGTQSPNHHWSSRLRCAVHRPRHGARSPANQLETGLSKRGAMPFRSPTNDRRGFLPGEPNAKS